MSIRKAATSAAALFLVAGLAGAGEQVGPPEPRRATRVDLRLYEGPGPLRAAAIDAAWVAGAGAFDVAVSRYAQDRCPSCSELNPLARATGGRFDTSDAALLKAGFTAGFALVSYELHKAGRHREAKLARWVVVGVWVGAGLVGVVQSR